MFPSMPFADLLNTHCELWLMFNSLAVTAVDPHGKLDFSLPPSLPASSVGTELVQLKREKDIHCIGLAKTPLSHIVQRFSVSH